MKTILRVCWWPIGMTLRLTAWVMFPPLGWMLGRRRRSARRHRQLVQASRRVVVVHDRQPSPGLTPDDVRRASRTAL